MSKKLVTVFAGILAAALAVGFLANLALKIGEAPLIIIVFGVVAAMLVDFVDTMRDMWRNSANGNGGPPAQS